MTINYSVCIMFITMFLCAKAMENVIKIDKKNSITMPSLKILKDMLEDTSLHHYAKQEELDTFYNLAEKDVSAGFLLYIIEPFYSNFRFAQLTNAIPKNLNYPKIGVFVSMEYAYFVKKLFEKNPDCWMSIERRFVEEVRMQGEKDFEWLNIKETFYQLK